MAAGYNVTVNPNATILEKNGDNNSFVIGEATRLWIYWLWIDVPYGVRNTVEFGFDAYILTGEDQTQVADWNIRQDIEWGSCFTPYHCFLELDDIETYWFDIYGDEVLEISIRVDHPGTLRRSYTISDIFESPPGEVVILGTEAVVIIPNGIMEDTVGYLIILMGIIGLPA